MKARRRLTVKEQLQRKPLHADERCHLNQQFTPARAGFIILQRFAKGPRELTVPARPVAGDLDFYFARLASSLLRAGNRQIAHVSRQPVGGEVAVSTVEHHRHADARAHGQIGVERGKGQGGLKVQVVAIERFHASLQRVESQHATAAKVEEAVVINTVVCYIIDHIGKILTDGGQHLAQTGEGPMFIAKDLNHLPCKVLVTQGTLHERQVVGSAGELVFWIVAEADEIGLLHGWVSFQFTLSAFVYPEACY